jgi:hypothetical protein
VAFLDVAKNDIESLSVKIQQPTFYWVEKGGNDGGLAVTYFLVQSNVVRRDASGVTEFLIRLPLLKAEDRKSSPAPRTLSLNLGNRDENIVFAADSKVNPNRKVRCHFIPSDLAKSGQVPTTSNAIMPGVYVKIEPIRAPLTAFQRFDSELVIKGVDGPLETGAIANSILTNYDFGETDLIAVMGNVSGLIVDGMAASTKVGDQIYVIGEIGGSFGDNGKAKFNGIAQVLWRNGHRVNKTRWEKLSTEWQLAVLAWLGSLLFGLYGLLRPTFARLGDNTPFRLR